MAPAPRAAEYFGQGQLVDALSAVIYQPEVDLAVVRDALTDADTLNWLGNGAVTDDLHGRLYDAVPSLRKADAVVREAWRDTGYLGMQVVDGIGLDSLRTTAVDPHADVAYEALEAKPSWAVEAIALGSLCLYGERVFAAQKSDERFMTADGRFDAERYDEHPAVREAGNHGDTRIDWPRTEVHVTAGDLVWIAHHPIMTVHAVRQRSDRSAARLLSWRAINQAA